MICTTSGTERKNQMYAQEIELSSVDFDSRPSASTVPRMKPMDAEIAVSESV